MVTCPNAFKAADFIAEYHTRFADHDISSKQPDSYIVGTLMRSINYLRAKPAAMSVTIPAVLFDGTKTVISIKVIPDIGIQLIEYPVKYPQPIDWRF